jgi:hypothetical protein
MESGSLEKHATAVKGDFGEGAAKISFSAMKDYVALESKLPGNKGMDHVYVKFGNAGAVEEIIVLESKYQSSPVNNDFLEDKFLRY